MAGLLGENELVVIALGLQRPGHALIGDDPVAHARARSARAVVTVGDVQPDAERLVRRGLGNEVLVVFPRAVRGGDGIVAQVDERAGEHEHGIPYQSG